MFLIKTVGIDLGSTSGGIATLEIRQGEWLPKVINAASYTAWGGTFANQYRTVYLLLEYIKQAKPLLVGIEDIKNRGQAPGAAKFGSSAAGIIHGMLRLLMWEAGIPWLEIHAMRCKSFVEEEAMMVGKNKDRKDYKYTKQIAVDWVKLRLGATFTGNQKEIQDQSDAAVYASIASMFYAGYWLQDLPPLDDKRKRMFRNKTNGFLTYPSLYLYRNSEKEQAFYATTNAG